MRVGLLAIAIALVFWGLPAQAQVDRMNFKDRQAIIIDNAASYIQLSGFAFKNEFSNSRTRLTTDLSWTNVSDKPITAFEVVILEYDPFNRPLSNGGRWLITGHNSGDWSPLMPGQTSSDGLIGYDDEPVLTSVVFVRAIRFQDGQVWNFDRSSVEKSIRQRLPVLKDLGNVSPPVEEPKKQ